MKVPNVAIVAVVLSLTACVAEVGSEQKTPEQSGTDPVAAADQDPSQPPAPAASQVAPANSLGCQTWGCGTNHNRRLVRI